MVWEVLCYVVEIPIHGLIWVLLDLEGGLVNEV